MTKYIRNSLILATTALAVSLTPAFSADDIDNIQSWTARPIVPTRAMYATQSVEGEYPATTSWWMWYFTDSDGRRFQLMRRFDGGKTAGNFLASLQPPTIEAPTAQYFSKDQYYLGPITVSTDGDVVYKPADGAGPAFEMRIDKNLVTHWKDVNGKIDLACKPAAKGVMFDHIFMHYMTAPCIVSGTFDGKKVQGVGMFDTAYFKKDPALGKNYFPTPGAPPAQQPTRDWIIFHNRYEDGTRDFGLFIKAQKSVGAQPTGICYYVHGKTAPKLSKTCSVKPTYTADGMISVATIDMDGQKFEFSPTAKVYDANPAKRWVVGPVKNHALPKPLESWGWYEWLARPKS